MNKSVLYNNVRTEISRKGREYAVKHILDKNEFGESTSKVEEFTIPALYHVGTSHIKEITDTGATYRTKRTPMVLVVKETRDLLSKGDIITINDIKHEIVEFGCINDMNVVYDISLRAIDEGA